MEEGGGGGPKGPCIASALAVEGPGLIRPTTQARRGRRITSGRYQPEPSSLHKPRVSCLAFKVTAFGYYAVRSGSPGAKGRRGAGAGPLSRRHDRLVDLTSAAAAGQERRRGWPHSISPSSNGSSARPAAQSTAEAAPSRTIQRNVGLNLACSEPGPGGLSARFIFQPGSRQEPGQRRHIRSWPGNRQVVRTSAGTARPHSIV